MSLVQSFYKPVIDPASAAGQAYDAGYVKPIRYQVIIKTADETQTLHNYDPWGTQGQSGIMLEKVSLTHGLLTSGDFSITFSDARDRVVDPRKVDVGCVVIIKGGKDKDHMVNLFQGITFGRRRSRYRQRGVRYELTGLGFGSILSSTFVNFQKNAAPVDPKADNPLLNVQKAYDTTDIRFFSYNLMHELFEDPTIRPFGGSNLKSMGSFSLDGISDLVTEFLPNNYYPMIAVSEILRNWSDLTGAIVTIDEDRVVNWFYPGRLISGHVIKSTFTDNGTNPGQWTAFSNGSFATMDSIYPDTAFANRLIARAEKIDITSGSPIARGATSLYNKDLSQYLPSLDNGFMTNTTVIMSKTGSGTDIGDPDKRFVFGALVEDVDLGSGNHSPTGQLVATFRIAINDIQPQPTPIQRLNMIKKVPSVDIAKGHWLIWYERGSGDASSASAGFAPDNTVYWWHNNDFKTEGQWSAIRPLKFPEGRSDEDKFSNVNWRVRNPGPTYTCGFSTSTSILCEMSDPASIARWTPNRPIEAIIPTIPGASVRTMQIYLAHMIRYTARKRRQFEFEQVTIPNRLFKLGASVQIIDPGSVDLQKGMNTLAQIQEVQYYGDVYSDDARGSCFCRILPQQYISASQEI